MNEQPLLRPGTIFEGDIVEASVYIIFSIDHRGSPVVEECFADEKLALSVLNTLLERDSKIPPEYRGHYYLEGFPLVAYQEG